MSVRHPSAFASHPYELNICIAVIWRSTRNTTKVVAFPELPLGTAGTRQPGRYCLNSSISAVPRRENCTKKGWRALPEQDLQRLQRDLSRSSADTRWCQGELHSPAPKVESLIRLLQATNQSPGARTGDHWDSSSACLYFSPVFNVK